MMENGKSRKRRQLTPEEKWEIFLEVTSQEISQADAARKYGVDVSVIIRLRALAKDAALAAFASAKPGARSCDPNTGKTLPGTRAARPCAFRATSSATRASRRSDSVGTTAPGLLAAVSIDPVG
jgi:transposase-like protein